jgi:APA family basic amino acid/polyamine antiporter
LGQNELRRKGLSALNAIGIGLSVLAVITGLWHQQSAGWDTDKTLLVISFIFAFTHCAFYVWRMWKQAQE